MHREERYRSKIHYDDCWQTPLDRDLFFDKRVAIVGNAQSLFSQSFGSIIDANDIVCRFNAGVQITDLLAQGRKLHVAFLSITIAEMSLFFATLNEQQPSVPIVHTSNRFRCRCGDNVYYIPASSNEEISRLAGVNRPSSGLMALHYILNSFPKAVNIFGFDWKATPTFYDLKRENEPHDYDAEKSYIKSMLSSNCLLWNENSSS